MNKIRDETEKARTIVMFLKNDINTAMKREKREVQNRVDMDGLKDSGDVSESESKTIIRLRVIPSYNTPNAALPRSLPRLALYHNPQHKFRILCYVLLYRDRSARPKHDTL